LLFPQYFEAAFSQVNPSNFNIPILTGRDRQRRRQWDGPGSGNRHPQQSKRAGLTPSGRDHRLTRFCAARGGSVRPESRGDPCGRLLIFDLNPKGCLVFSSEKPTTPKCGPFHGNSWRTIDLVGSINGSFFTWTKRNGPEQIFPTAGGDCTSGAEETGWPI
jgi:hypothetical protein